MSALALTATEVAALSGVDESRIRKEVEYGVFTRPSFTLADLVYFAVLSVLGVQLGVGDRRKLHTVVTAALGSRRPQPIAAISPVLEVRLDRVTKDVEEKLARFEAWKQKRVVTNPGTLGGEPAFPGTRLAVRQVGGMLLRGASKEDAREDYPSLTDEDFEFAPVFVTAYPRMGRPRERLARPLGKERHVSSKG